MVLDEYETGRRHRHAGLEQANGLAENVGYKSQTWWSRDRMPKVQCYKRSTWHRCPGERWSRHSNLWRRKSGLTDCLYAAENLDRPGVEVAGWLRVQDVPVLARGLIGPPPLGVVFWWLHGQSLLTMAHIPHRYEMDLSAECLFWAH